MNISDFPNYSQWLQVAHAQSQGAILVGLIALGGVVWLVMARATWPRLLPFVRLAILALYFISLGVLLLIGVKNV